MHHFAVSGKSGISKSTAKQNIVATLAESGKKVLLMGFDPEADSIRLLLYGMRQRTILETLGKKATWSSTSASTRIHCISESG